MPTFSLGYQEPAYVSIMRRYKPQTKKHSSILTMLSGRRMKKLLRRHVFKNINKKFYA
jgi:hypothetical protein